MLFCFNNYIKTLSRASPSRLILPSPTLSFSSLFSSSFVLYFLLFSFSLFSSPFLVFFSSLFLILPTTFVCFISFILSFLPHFPILVSFFISISDVFSSRSKTILRLQIYHLTLEFFSLYVTAK